LVTERGARARARARGDDDVEVLRFLRELLLLATRLLAESAFA